MEYENDSIYHHGILGQKWGLRRYQNPDGTLTEAGRRRLEKKDAKWAKRRYNKIYNRAYKSSKKEFKGYLKNDLNPRYKGRYKKGTKSLNYANEYNRKLAELMSGAAKDLRAPSGRAVRFVAKRGELGVHMALADVGFDMNQLKNGVYGSGRIAYRQNKVNMT